MKRSIKAPVKEGIKTMTFLPGNIVCTFTGQPSILEMALQQGVDLNHSCGGMGSCTTCRVLIEQGAAALEPRNELEQEHAQMRGFEPRERLACQTTAIDGLRVTIPGSE